MDYVKYIKGGVWWCELGSNGNGIMSYRHPVVIISAVKNPKGVCSVTVLPISECKAAEKKGKLQELYCIPLDLQVPSYVCCSQIRTIVTSELQEYIGQLTGQKLKEVDEELQRYLQMMVMQNDSYEEQEPEIEEDNFIDVTPTIIEDRKVETKSKNKGRSTPIYNVNEKKWYSSIGEAVEDTGVSRPTISKILKDGCVRCGYLFKRKEDVVEEDK